MDDGTAARRELPPNCGGRGEADDGSKRHRQLWPLVPHIPDHLIHGLGIFRSVNELVRGNVSCIPRSHRLSADHTLCGIIVITDFNALPPPRIQVREAVELLLWASGRWLTTDVESHAMKARNKYSNSASML
jgi:hypothetical protein